MEVFGTVASAIDLVQKIKATLDQAKTNRRDDLILSSEIVDSLLRIQELIHQNSFVNSPELRDDLSAFESALRTTLSRRERLIKPESNGLWDRTVTRSKEIYHSSDTKNELTELRQRIQACYQNLQIKCTVRTDDGVANANVHLEAIRKDELPAVREDFTKVNDSVLKLSDTQEAFLLSIKEIILEKVGKAEQDTEQAQQLVGLRKMSAFQVSKSLESTTEALQAGGSDSELENRYLKVKVKALTEALPKFTDGSLTLPVLPPSSGARLMGWTSYYPEMTKDDDKRDDSVQEVMRISKLLRSGKIISYGDVVNTLEGLGLALGELTLSEEQAEVCRWAVQICRQRAKDGAVASALALAGSLYNLVKPVFDLGKYADAVEVSKEAVDICRQRSNSDPVLLPTLAFTLTNYSGILYELGQLNDARIASGESVGIYRKHVEDHPEGLVQELARSLMIHSDVLNALGRSEEALRLGEESVNIYRKLIQNQQTRFLPALAESLTTCTTSLTMLGQHSDSLQLQEEVIQIYQTLVRDQQKQFYSPYLARSLLNVSIALGYLERYEAAIAPSEEAIKILRKLVAVEYTRFVGDLAEALSGIAWWQHKLGHHSDALTHVEEALQLLSKCEKPPSLDSHNCRLSEILDIKSVCLSDLGQHDQGMVAGQASLEISRRLNQVNPEFYKDVLSEHSLNYSRALYRGGGDLKEARIVAEESVGHYRILANKTPLRYNTELKGALEHLSQVLFALEAEESAKDISEEASKLSC